MYLCGFSRFAQATMAVVSGHALNLPESIPGRDRSSKQQSRRASACNLHALFFVHIIISYHLLTSHHCIIGKYEMCWIQRAINTWQSKPRIGDHLCMYALGENRGTADKATSHLLRRCHITNVLTIDLVPLDCPHGHAILISLLYAPTLPSHTRTCPLLMDWLSPVER